MKYYDKIDGLRFVAIFLVLIQHFAPIIAAHTTAGFYGVDLFFVISGFLITTILLQPTKKSFGNEYKTFLWRRILRIFPVYYLSILILWLLNVEHVRDQLFWFVTYTYNYAFVYYKLPGSPLGNVWSLCVEEQFYLFWPLIVLSLKNKPRYLILLLCIIILTAYTQYIFDVFPSLSPYNYCSLFTRMGSLGLGALGAVLSLEKLLWNKLFKSLLVEVIMFLILIISLLVSYKIKVLVLAECSLYLVIKCANYDFCIKPVRLFLSNKYIIRLGTISYGIYIFHGPVAYYAGKYFVKPFWYSINFDSLGMFSGLRWHAWIIKLSVYGSLSILVAWLSYKFIERPILRFKNRSFKY